MSGGGSPAGGVAWHATSGFGVMPSPHGQELCKSRASGQCVYIVLAGRGFIIGMAHTCFLRVPVLLGVVHFEAANLLLTQRGVFTFLLHYALFLAPAVFTQCVMYGFSVAMYVLYNGFAQGTFTVFVGVQWGIGAQVCASAAAVVYACYPLLQGM